MDKNMKKYNIMYSSMGYHVIRFSPSDRLTFLNSKSHPKFAYKLLDMMKTQLKLVNNPIITHMFSNASIFILYQHIILEINSRRKDYEFFKRNHKATIYDSSSGWGRVSNLFHAIADLAKAHLTNNVSRYIFSTVVITLSLSYHEVNFGNHYHNNMFSVLVNDNKAIPCLYLYSKADNLLY